MVFRGNVELLLEDKMVSYNVSKQIFNRLTFTQVGWICHQCNTLAVYIRESSSFIWLLQDTIANVKVFLGMFFFSPVFPLWKVVGPCQCPFLLILGVKVIQKSGSICLCSLSRLGLVEIVIFAAYPDINSRWSLKEPHGPLSWSWKHDLTRHN